MLLIEVSYVNINFIYYNINLKLNYFLWWIQTLLLMDINKEFHKHELNRYETIILWQVFCTQNYSTFTICFEISDCNRFAHFSGFLAWPFASCFTRWLRLGEEQEQTCLQWSATVCNHLQMYVWKYKIFDCVRNTYVVFVNDKILFFSVSVIDAQKTTIL